MAQQVLAKWGILKEEEKLEKCKLKMYLDTYKKPLSEPEMEAIRTLSQVAEVKKKRKKHASKTGSKSVKAKKVLGKAQVIQPPPVTLTET